jgi:hypothetical protein
MTNKPSIDGVPREALEKLLMYWPEREPKPNNSIICYPVIPAEVTELRALLTEPRPSLESPARWFVPADIHDQVVADLDELRKAINDAATGIPAGVEIAKVPALLAGRLNVTDQRIDYLVELLTEARISVDYHAGMKREGENESLYDLLVRINAALQPTEAVLIAAGLGYPLSKEDAVKTYKATLQPRTDHPNNEDCEWCGGCGHDPYGDPCVGCCKPTPASVVLPDHKEMHVLISKAARQADLTNGANFYTASELAAIAFLKKVKELNQ